MGRFVYNIRMLRKKRSDRNHIIYKLESGKDFYIGVTAKTQTTVNRSAQVRFNKHVYRMRSEPDKGEWKLYASMLKKGAETFTVTILEVVRGKAPAHKRERQLIAELQPNLNSDTRGC